MLNIVNIQLNCIFLTYLGIFYIFSPIWIICRERKADGGEPNEREINSKPTFVGGLGSLFPTNVNRTHLETACSISFKQIWRHGVMDSIWGFEPCDPGSNPGAFTTGGMV